MSSPVVAAVLVAYHPTPSVLQRVIEAVERQVDVIIVVNNGGFYPDEIRNFAKCTLLDLGHNAGVAAAHNAGILHAKGLGAQYFLILDQDSIPAPDMVARLVSISMLLRDEGVKVAACGPRYLLDADQGASEFLEVGKTSLRRVKASEDDDYVKCDFLISSGSLITNEAFDAVGEMEEALFVDHVDTEWCFRAKREGFYCFGVPSAWMKHALGSDCRSIRWGGRVRRIPRHSAARYYFIVRNSILLNKRQYMPSVWKLHNLQRTAGLVIINGLLARTDLQTLIMAWRGFCDGIKGVSGSGLSNRL
jgi:rhamnosyltransferase